MADYPSAVYAPRTKENKPGIVYDALKTTIGYAEDVVKLDDEVVAIEAELGLNPKGSSADITERLKSIRSFIGADADVLIVKGDMVQIGGVAPPGAGAGVKLIAGGVKAKVVIKGTSSSQWGSLQVLNSVDDNLEYLVYGRGAGGTYFGLSRAGLGVLGGSVNSAMAIGTRTNTPLILAANNLERVRINANGNVGFGTLGPTAKIDINSNVLRLRTAKTPASAGDTGNQGDICWDANYIYICVATNTWRRIVHNTW